MYFSNITNEELQYFHNLKVPNFSIKLSDLLESDLFKIETIITDSIYKIYPLFYTSEITSTNTNDKILEDKCIICQKQEEETYFTFISDDTQQVHDYQNYANYFTIGNSLTLNQYHTIVSLLRANTIHTDEIKLKQGIVNGKYADYIFDIDSSTIIDTGILITNETLSSVGTVKLVNNKFKWSTYTLKLKVYHITDVNVCNEVHSDNIVVDDLDIELEKDTQVNIPFNALGYNYVIGIDATVEITHDKPVIRYIDGLSVTADSSTVQIGDATEIYGQLLDNNGYNYDVNDANGKTVYFYEKLEPTITLSGTETIIETGDTMDINAKVIDEDGSIAKNTTVHFYKKEEE